MIKIEMFEESEIKVQCMLTLLNCVSLNFVERTRLLRIPFNKTK